METKILQDKLKVLDNEFVQKNNEKVQTERMFLDVLCRNYTTVNYVDLKSNIAKTLKVDKSANAAKILPDTVSQKINYKEIIKSYCDKFVVGKKEFLEVMQPEHLLNELTKAEKFVYRYESIPNKAGHKHFEVHVVRVNENEFDGTAIVAFCHIDDIIAKEIQYQLKLEKTAYSDVLTGIGNRTAFRKELIECEIYKNAGCVVADINNLKLCNDRYGHQEGDKIIADAAECISKAFEEVGKCYRIGGDEFCVLIHDVEISSLLLALEKMEELIAQKNKTRIMQLSIAVGYSIRENEQESMEQLFNRSDEMMYDVKHQMKKAFPVYREERIKNYLSVLKILSKSTDDYLFLFDITKDETWFLGDIDKKYAIRDKGIPTNTIQEMVAITHKADRKMLIEDLEQVTNGKKDKHDMDYRWINRNGEVVWISCRATVVKDDKGKPFVLIGRVSDTSLRYLYHSLTKLFNKEKMLMDLKKGLFGSNFGYFMFVAIDHLGSINLKHGRNYGDKIIKECAMVLEDNSKLENIWHVENNCFALYLDVDTEEKVREVYDDLLDKLSDICTISAGVVKNSKEMFKDENNLYACAEMMLEKAKHIEMKTIVFFSQEDLQQRIKKLQFLEEMQESVKNGCEGFYLCYQPQVKTGNYKLFGAEALLRYHSKKQGEVYPDEFIPLLEQSKLINQVGMWVLEEALSQCKQWREIKPDFHISVNFSAVQLKEKDIGDKVLNTLDKIGLLGSALTIEITESTQLSSIRDLKTTFKLWMDAGIELSIDDFGTGYASMSYLKELNVNEIKIDKLFVQGVEKSTYNYRLIGNIIEFAKNNSIRICCEGVEDMRELTVLEGLAPNLIQGYLFAKPCEKQEFENHFVNEKSKAYQEYEEFVQKIYRYKGRMHTVYFDTKNILRETLLGLWIIRIKEDDNYYEMHADETMEKVICVDRKYTPKECYDFWFNRIKDGYSEYVASNVKRMIETGKVIQLQYPWIHPIYGEVIVRCTGKRVEDTDGMVTLEGYHRIVSNIESYVSEL